jgi:hypothetical protein
LITAKIIATWATHTHTTHLTRLALVFASLAANSFPVSAALFFFAMN